MNIKKTNTTCERSAPERAKVVASAEVEIA